MIELCNFENIQVEAALITDPENSELLKLKDDLIEVIELTRDLIKTQLKEQQKSSYVEPKTQATTSSVEEEEDDEEDDDEEEATKSDTYDEIEAALLAAEKGTRCQWKVGDKCQAKWTEDGNYYEAIIEDINSSGEVSVVFEAYQNRSTTTLTDLKERVMRNEVFPSTK